MLKNQLIKTVSKQTGVNSDQVRLVIESLRSNVLQAIKNGEEVMLLGIGKLSISRRGPKQARNIWTKEQVIVPPRNVPVFRPSVALTEAAQQADVE